MAGMTIILLPQGQVADVKSFGQQTLETAMGLDRLFRIYSMSKPITGVATMQLYEKGKRQLDDPVSKHAPELAPLKALTWDADGKVVTDAAAKAVRPTPTQLPTMRQLISHTAGFGHGPAGTIRLTAPSARLASSLGEPRRYDEEIAAISRLYEAGTRWSYSIVVDIQGYPAEKLSGQNLGDYLKQHVTGPMGMTDMAFYVTPDKKARFAEVYRWVREQNKFVMNPPRTDRGSFEDPRGSSRAGAASSVRHTTTRASARRSREGRDRRSANSEAGNRRVDDPQSHRRSAGVG